MKLSNTRTSGILAEISACEYLTQHGLHLIQQNYSCHYGEIDLIMRDHNDIVFIEVRSRKRFDYGLAQESIVRNKQSKLIKTAKYYLQTQGVLYKAHSRFDILAIQQTTMGSQINWIKNAFFARNY